MVRLADGFERAVPEEDRVTLVGLLVVGDRGRDSETKSEAALA
jgi:hypothetical protein